MDAANIVAAVDEMVAAIPADVVASDNLVRDGIVNRRFVAKFNGNGLKYSQSARPCTGNTQ